MSMRYAGNASQVMSDYCVIMQPQHSEAAVMRRTFLLEGKSNIMSTPSQLKQGSDDHASGCSASAHLAVEDEGCICRRLPEAPHEQGEVLLFGSLLIRHWHSSVLYLIPIVCAGNNSVTQQNIWADDASDTDKADLSCVLTATAYG